MYTVWIMVGGWHKEPHTNLQAAMLTWKMLRAEGFTCFVVLGGHHDADWRWAWSALCSTS